jgi:hypothetical protein
MRVSPFPSPALIFVKKSSSSLFFKKKITLRPSGRRKKPEGFSKSASLFELLKKN